jgi:[FeFe] hydrogenase (group B1/B3)
MRNFDTEVQYLKYRVLKAVSRKAFEGTLLNGLPDIPKQIIPGPKPTTRCCIYKERAIVSERIKLALGGNKDNPNVIEVIDIACDECPVAGYKVTESCRGCIAHRCQVACKFGAIYFDKNQKAHIDKDKCVECGACSKVCPYSAISNSKRPCENACKVNAISMDENRTAVINNDKCIKCGACVYQCPFGAIVDKSQITEVIDEIKGENEVYAIVAPSISAQFKLATFGQVITAIKMVGFDGIVEAAQGADLVAYYEAQELVEKGFLTTSCCPAFVNYIKANFSNLVKNISHNLSPMAMIAKVIKEKKPNAKTVFIGPCTAKKAEAKLDTVSPYVDYVLTFEELIALFGAKDIPLRELEESKLDDASLFGRNFARSGGVTEAVKQSLKEQNINFDLNPISCDGIENLKLLLLKANKGLLPNNFIEGMVCTGGCIGGPCALTHEAKDKSLIDKHGASASKKEILINVEKLSK